jgi:hypothetical protein
MYRIKIVFRRAELRGAEIAGHPILRAAVAIFFVSYTSQDRVMGVLDSASSWEKLGHMPRVHEWEISGGGDIAVWMEEAPSDCRSYPCVISKRI